MASANVTVTAPLGPGNTVASKLFSGCKAVNLDVDKEMFYVTDAKGVVHDFEYDTIATLTWSISGAVATVAVST
jgi:hypothetical protein